MILPGIVIRQLQHEGNSVWEQISSRISMKLIPKSHWILLQGAAAPVRVKNAVVNRIVAVIMKHVIATAGKEPVIAVVAMKPDGLYNPSGYAVEQRNLKNSG